MLLTAQVIPKSEKHSQQLNATLLVGKTYKWQGILHSSQAILLIMIAS